MDDGSVRGVVWWACETHEGALTPSLASQPKTGANRDDLDADRRLPPLLGQAMYVLVSRRASFLSSHPPQLPSFLPAPLIACLYHTYIRQCLKMKLYCKRSTFVVLLNTLALYITCAHMIDQKGARQALPFFPLRVLHPFPLNTIPSRP